MKSLNLRQALDLEIRYYGQLVQKIKCSKVDITTHGIRVVSDDDLHPIEDVVMYKFSELNLVEKGYIFHINGGLTVRVT